MSTLPIKSSISDSELSSPYKKGKYLFVETDSAIVNPPPVSDGDLSSSLKKKDKHQDAEDRGIFRGPESAIVNPPGIISDEDISSRRKDADDPGFFLGPESAIANPSSMRNSIGDKHHEDEDSSLSLPLPTNISVKPRVFTFNFNRPTPDPTVYLNKAWKLLKPAIRSILHHEPQGFSCAAIFNAVHGAWWANSGEALFKLIEDECGAYVSAAIRSLEEQRNDDSSVLFPLMEKAWVEFRSKMQFLCSFAGGEGQRVGGKTLLQLVVELFPNHLYSATQLRDKVLSNIIVLITDQRSGKVINTSHLANVMKVFQGPSFYESPFLEKPFLECAAEFYSAEAKQILPQWDISLYLKHVEQRLHEEKEKCNSLYFFMKNEEPLIEVVEREFLGVHAAAIFEKGFAKLMDESCVDDLQRMYGLFSGEKLVGHLEVALSSYISETGRKILEKGSSLKEFKASVEKIWLSYFLEDKLLEKTVEQCFKDLVCL